MAKDKLAEQGKKLAEMKRRSEVVQKIADKFNALPVKQQKEIIRKLMELTK